MHIFNKNIDLGMVLEIDRYRYKNRKENSFLFILRSIFSFLFFNFKKTNIVESADFLFFKSSDRKDCNLFFDSVMNQCYYTKSVLDNIEFKFRICFVKWFLLFYLWKYFISIKNSRIELSETIFLYIKFVRYYYNSIWKLQNSNFKVVVVFSDMQPMDNLVSQYFHLKKTKTVTLQHGLYIEYNNFNTSLIVQYKNVVSDFFLAWGEETKCLIQKHHPKINIVICGKPIYLEQKSSRSNSFMSIIFDSNYLKEYNRKLLDVGIEICKILNIKLHVRFHPLNNKKEYKIDNTILLTEANVYNSMFVIGHSSTFLFELMVSGIPSYKLFSKIPSNKVNSNICFSSAKDLIELLNIELNFKKESEFYIKYSGDESKKKYSDFFTTIIKHD